MDKNPSSVPISSVSSKRVRVKRSMLVEQHDDENIASKTVQDSNDFSNDISFVGLEDCDFVNRLRQPDKIHTSPSNTSSSPRISPVPRYTVDDPPSWLAPSSIGARQASDNSTHFELDVALGLKASPNITSHKKEGSKSVPLSPMNNLDGVEKLSHMFNSPKEPSSARSSSITAQDFEKSLRSETTFYSPPPIRGENETGSLNSDGSKDGGTVLTASKRRQRRSETSTSLSDPNLNQVPLDDEFITRNIRTANSSDKGSTMWGTQPTSNAQDVPMSRRKGSWLDSSPRAGNQHNVKQLVTRTQLSPRDLSPLSEPKSNNGLNKSSDVIAIEKQWRAKFEAAMLEANNAKAALLEARSKINEQGDRILMLEAELERVSRKSPQKSISAKDSPSLVAEEKGGVAFDIQIGNPAQRSKVQDNTPQTRDRLMARLGMSASQRRMLAVVEPDAKLSRVLHGDDALPSALGHISSQGSMVDSQQATSRVIHEPKRVVTWQEEAGGGNQPRAPINRPVSSRRVSDSNHRPQCATCGTLSGLEADEDNPGTYYCVRCWEEYENEDNEDNTEREDLLKVNTYSPRSDDPRIQQGPLKSPIAGRKMVSEIFTKKSAFADRCFVLSDNTHLLNQVAILLGNQSSVTALVETKGAKGKIRMIVAQIVTVGCCHAVGSKGADLGTDVVVAKTEISTDPSLIHLDGSRGSMFIELASMYAYEKEPGETQQETMGDFKGFRMPLDDGIPLDGRAMDKQWKDHAQKMLRTTVDDAAGRVDVILAPQKKGDWYPMWEVSSGRRMAPQFRSSGVGYLRLADDMGSHGNSFISVDGKSYLGEAGFDETVSSPSNANESTPNTVRRRRSEAESGDYLGELRSRTREAKEALQSLKVGCGAGGSESELKWKDKSELLKKAAISLEQVCALHARSAPGGILPMVGNSTSSSTPQGAQSIGQEEAVSGVIVAQRVLGDRGKNVHVLSGALALLRSSGMLCGDRCPASPTWRIVFPQLLTLFRDSSKVVATAAIDTADALHLRCFRIGDPSSLGFIIAELQLLGGKNSGAKGGAVGKAPRSVSAIGMVSWLLRALNRERSAWDHGGDSQCIGSQPVAAEALAAAILPLLTHREIDTRDVSAQALASLLLSTEASLTAKGQQPCSSQGQGHLSLLLPLNASDPKAYAKVVGYLSEGRKRGDHVPMRAAPSASLKAAPMRGSAKIKEPTNGNDILSLRRLWGQIEYVLRKPVQSPNDLEHLGQHAAAGASYLKTLSSTASALGLRKGALSRAVLPFDDQTSLADQSNLDNRKTRSLEAMELLKSGQLSEAALDSMQVDAVKLRALLRVKIADDADLDQARSALEDVQLFLRKLSTTASSEGRSAFDLLKAL